MAIKNTLMGGTDWNNGEVLDADDQNDTFDAATIRGLLIDSSATDATTYTHTGNTTFNLEKTFTFTPSSSNNMILGYKIQADLKTTGAAVGVADVEVTPASGNTSGVTFYATTSIDTQSASFVTLTMYSMGFSTVKAQAGSGQIPRLAQDNASEIVIDQNSTASGGLTFLTGGSSYAFKIYLRTSSAGETVSMTNIIVTVYYLDNGIVTTSSGKFS